MFDKDSWFFWRLKMWTLPLAVLFIIAWTIVYLIIGWGRFEQQDYLLIGAMAYLALTCLIRWTAELRTYRKALKNPKTRPFLTEWTRK